MGLSGNGSEGLGGHAEGFEQQNQGITRRAPGEGPKVSGGRSQPQQMDTYDQPQFKNEGQRSDGAPFDDWAYNAEWVLRKRPEFRHAFEDDEFRNEFTEAARRAWEDDAHEEEFVRQYLDELVPWFKNENQMPWMGMNDPGGWERQVATGLTNPGQEVSDDELGSTLDFGDEEMEEATMGGEADVWIAWAPGEYGANPQQLLRKIGLQGPLLDKLWGAGQYAQVGLSGAEAQELAAALAKAISGKRASPDVRLAQDVIGQIEGSGMDESKEDELAKSSAKEKEEHPWLSPEEAARVAKDHMKGEAKMAEVFRRARR